MRGVRAYGAASSTVALGSAGSGTCLVGDEAGRQEARRARRDEREQGEHGERQRPGAVASATASGRCPPPAGGPALTFRPACRSTISPSGWPGWPAWRWSRSCWPGGVRLPEPSRNDHAARLPRRGGCRTRSPTGVAPPYHAAGPLRRVWAVVASSGLAIVIGAVLATVTAFSLAWVVTTLTDLLRQ